MQFFIHLGSTPADVHGILRHFQTAGGYTTCIHSLTRCIHNLILNKEVNGLRRTSHIGNFAYTSHIIINQVLCIFAIQLVLCCARQSDIRLYLPWAFARNKSGAGEFVGIRSYNIIARCAKFQHIINLFTANTVRIIDITVRTGDGNDFRSQLGSLRSSAPSHISETGDSNGLAFNVNAFGLQHLMYKI